MQKSRVYKLLTWIVVCAQILMVAGAATVGVVQPTPQMVAALAAEAGWSDWVSAGLGVLTRQLQPLWGEPASAKASAIRDVGPHPYYQWLTTVHPEENMVVNGSFEMGPEGLNITSIPGWTVASGKVDLWNGYFNPDGSFSEIDLAGTPGPGVLEQTITGLVAGQSYFFEFSYSANTFANEQAKVQVLDGGTPLIDQTVTAAGHPYSAGWQHFRQSFTAPASGIVKLRFQDLSVDPHIYHGVIIDDVRVARRLINYVLNGSFEAGPHGLNTTIIPHWIVESGHVDIHAAYFHPDRSTGELDLAGSPGPGIARQTVSGLTPGQSYIFEFDYTVNAFPNEQAKVQVLDGGTALIDQTVTTNGDANHKGWKHFRQSFTAPAGGSITLRFQDLSTDVFTNHGILVDNVRVADEPLNYVVNGDFENSPAALNIANDAIPGWTVVSGPVDVFNPGLLYEKMVDLNGSPGNGKIEQTVTGLTAGQVYAFQFNYQNHAWWTTYAYARLLDSANAKLYEKRISCKGHVVHEGWCTLRYFFTAPGNGQVKIVFENDETDGNAYYGVNVDNVFISRDLNYVVNGNYNSGPIGLNQTKVPGWSVGGPTDTHDNFGGEYRFTVDLNGSPGDGKLRQVIKGLAPGQSYTLRYNYASTAHNYLVNFDVKVTDSTGATTLLNVAQSTNQLPYVGGWRQAEHTFTAPADGVVQVNFNNNETDNNPYYAALIDNIQLWGQAAAAGTEVNVCNGTIVLPRPPLAAGPGGVTNGLAFWVRADQEVFSDGGATAAVEGDTVQQWNDQSGAGLDLTQTTAGQKPTYRSGVARGNFNPTLDFSDDFIRNTSRVVQTTDDLTMIAVGDTDVTGGVRTLIGMGDNYNDPTIDLDGTWISPWFDGGGTVDLFTGETLPTSRAMIWGMRGNNSESNGMHFNYSGEDIAMNMTVADQANYGQNIGLGSDGGGEDWDGRIPEAMVYSRNLRPAEMEKVYSYLAIKYGITMRLSTLANSTAGGDYVSSKGALVWNYDGNSNYHNDVAGIARDDASALEQKQANSVNSDNLITIGLGGIAATNAENINTFDADQSFLLWGNDNGATTLATSVSVSLTRMARIWAVQETTPITAPIGVVTMRVPQSAFSLGVGQQAFLLRSDDPVFTNADEVIFFTCDGTNCETTIDFADGDYFTLARANAAPEISVTPSSSSFGNVGTSESSPVKNVVISNSGNAPLNLTSLQMTNDGSGQFTNNNSCGAILNPGASCAAGVTFTPNASGAQSGVLTIASNDSDEASVAVNLSGTGVAQAPAITVLPTTLSFTNTMVNSAAPAQSVVVNNSGTGNLAIQNLSLGGVDSDQFVLVGPGSSCTPLTKNLAGSESCDVEVVFSPTSAGNKSATLVIASNDTDEITTTVTLNGVAATCSSALNTVTVTADSLESVDQDNKAAVCVTIVAPPNLTIGKSGPVTATQNTNFAYTLVVTNTSVSATSGVITVTDSLPAGLSFVSGSGSGFTCAASGQNVTCTSSSVLAGNNGTATITLTVSPTTTGAKSNTASVIGGGDSSAATSNTVNTTVIGVPDLTTTIGQPSPAFVAGVASNVPMTVSNIGTGPTTGPITATMTLPANTSAPASFTGGVWTCTTVGQTVTCTQSGPINAGASSTIQVPVTASPATVGTQPGPFNGGVTTPGDSNPGNNPSTPMTPTTPVSVAPTANLLISKSGPASATQGTNFSYTLVVTNSGTAATSGVITVTDSLPAGLNFVSGSGFTCTASGQMVTCTSSAAIAVNGTATINLTVTPTAAGLVSNSASVIGGGDGSAATSNTVNTTVNANATAPTITGGGGGANATVSIPENTTVVTTVTASGTAPITYSIVGGADAAKFTINPNTGALSFVTAPDYEAPTDNGSDNIYDVTVRASNSAGTDERNFAVTVTDMAGDTTVTLPVKLFLQGPYLQAAGMMTDTLRSKGLVPTSSPYTATATTTAGVLAVTGNNAIVDWVLVEVRNSATPATVVARQSALLQRDGDVVAVNGTSTLTFTLAAGNYHVAVKHRNHLGAMTATPVVIAAATPLVDFTTSTGYGTSGQATVGGVYALWMGNTSGDNRVIGAGPTNDRNAILAEALSAPGNANHNANYIVTGYSNSDVNLDGRVIAAGPGNDINFILYTVFVHPGNGSAAANFVVQGQMP